MPDTNKVIVISEREPGLPYSKGLRATELMVTGLPPYRAYQVAEERYATNFLRWNDIAQLDVPLVILIGGATGVGKSTIATQLAARLGIVRVVATDAIREVMRSMFSAELMPTLHTSSFQADRALREPPTRST